MAVGEKEGVRAVCCAHCIHTKPRQANVLAFPILEFHLKDQQVRYKKGFCTKISVREKCSIQDKFVISE